MSNESPNRFNRFDALRLAAAVLLCAAAAFAFYLREQPVSAMGGVTGKQTYISITKTPLATDAPPSVGVTSASVTATEPPPSPIVPLPITIDSKAEGVREVTIDLTSDAPQATAHPDGYSSVVPELSPEASEYVPEHDIHLNTITRQRDGVLRVLIYHTHTEEAFEQTDQYKYVSHGAWNTADNQCNVVRVGDELTRLLTEQYGMVVTHDTKNYAQPNYDTAYTRSLQALKGYTDRGETFDLYIDLHRDSYARKHAENTVTIGGVKSARLMVLIGKGEGYAQKPNWQENLKLAQALTDRLNGVADTLCDKVTLKNTTRYNQHISTNALLIEVGNNRNTLEEALAAMPYLAEAIDVVMGD